MIQSSHSPNAFRRASLKDSLLMSRLRSLGAHTHKTGPPIRVQITTPAPAYPHNTHTKLLLLTTVQIQTPAPLDQFPTPRLVRLMIDVENELLEFKRSVQKGQNLIQQFQLSASTFELEIAKNLQRLSAVMVEGVDQGVFNAPEISIGP